jgi:SAM-dependent methyltransferase
VSSISFDPAADLYDATRGYPPEVAEAIGVALCAAAGAGPGSHFLELGIGTGRIALPLLACGTDVTGVDISQRMVDRLRANLAARRAEHPERPWGTLEVHLADMSALPFPDASFDAVVAVHVLHLVPGWREALGEALRVLRPGGALLIANDRHPDTSYGQIRAQWRAIAREQGADVDPPGAAGREAVVDELRARGLAVLATIPVRWTCQRSPRESLDDVAGRVWSSTWAVPEPLFARSVERLGEWAREQFGDTLDTPREERAEFGLLCCVKPA